MYISGQLVSIVSVKGPHFYSMATVGFNFQDI